MVTIYKRLIHIWKNHWFSDEPSINFDMARILTAFALILALNRLGDPFAQFVYKDFSSWNPSGVLKLFGSSVPSSRFLSMSGTLAICFTFVWGLGAFTFISGPLSLCFALIAFSIKPSFTYGWSHGYTFNLLVQIPLVLSPIAGKISIDSLLKRSCFSWIPIHNEVNRIRWPLMLSFWLLGIAFLGVSLVKTLGNGSLSWIFSDNLRNIIFWRYQWRNEVPPDFASWLSNHEWAWKFSALGSCFLQMVPILACVFSRNNLVRLVASIAITMEIFGLAEVMRLNNYHWYPIAFIFVNWCWLTNYYNYDYPLKDSEPRPVKQFVLSAFLVTFLGYYSVLHFNYRDLEMDFRHNNYPLSGHRMYVAIKARQPYDHHFPFKFYGIKIEVDLKKGEIPVYIEATFPKLFVNSERLNSEKQIKQQMREIYIYLKDSGVRDIQKIKLYRAIYEAPPYPDLLIKVEVQKNLISSSLGEDINEFYIFEHGYKYNKPYISLKNVNGYVPSKEWNYRTTVDDDPVKLAGVESQGLFFYEGLVPKNTIFGTDLVDPTGSKQKFISFYINTKRPKK
jgi:hypothetical protein